MKKSTAIEYEAVKSSSFRTKSAEKADDHSLINETSSVSVCQHENEPLKKDESTFESVDLADFEQEIIKDLEQTLKTLA